MSKDYIFCDHPEAIKSAAGYLDYGQSLIDKAQKAAAGTVFTSDKGGILPEWQQGAGKIHDALSALHKKITDHGELSKNLANKVTNTVNDIHSVDTSQQIFTP